VTLLKVFLGLTIVGALGQSAQRVFVNEVYNEIPISVRLLPEKEKTFKNLTNSRWVDDFEIEVTNKGTKPIYFLLFSLVPDLGEPEGTRRLALTVIYGRKQLAFPDEPAIPTDIPIMPNEKVVLRVNDMDVKGWYHFIKVESWPEEKIKPPKATLFFEMLNYGDGTGYGGGDTVPYSVPKREYPRPQKTK
jgi:hypothetical protein